MPSESKRFTRLGFTCSGSVAASTRVTGWPIDAVSGDAEVLSAEADSGDGYPPATALAMGVNAAVGKAPRVECHYDRIVSLLAFHLVDDSDVKDRRFVTTGSVPAADPAERWPFELVGAENVIHGP